MAVESINIIEAIKDPILIGDTISQQQEVILRAIYGLPLQEGLIKTRVFEGRKLATKGSFKYIEETPEAFFCRITGRPAYVPRDYRECGIYIGARGGKSDKLSSNIGIYEALFRQHRLSRGEKAIVPCVAFDKLQAEVVFNYIKGKVTTSAVMAKSVIGEAGTTLELSNNVEIGVYPCSFRQLRGYSVPAAVCDEIAIWRDDQGRANPAKEVVRAVRRGMLTFQNAKLVKISSPYGKSGIVWDDWQSRLRKLSSLILKVPSWEVNPALGEEELLAQLEDDPDLFWREFGAEFSDSVRPLVPEVKLEAAICHGVTERKPEKGYKYLGVIDAAFRGDKFAFGVCHRQQSRVVWDLLKSWRGTRTDAVQMRTTLAEVEGDCRRYMVSVVNGDQYCAEPIKQALSEIGMAYEEFTLSQNSKQAGYTSLRTLFMSQAIDLLDHDESVNEIRTLEATDVGGGVVKIAAAAGATDDLATVLMIGSHLATLGSRSAESWIQALRNPATVQKRVTLIPGRTICVDCGKVIPLGEPYAGIGPTGMGQCQECQADHGGPNYAHITPGASAPKEINPQNVLPGEFGH